jgi:hypothetical protein
VVFDTHRGFKQIDQPQVERLADGGQRLHGPPLTDEVRCVGVGEQPVEGIVLRGLQPDARAGPVGGKRSGPFRMMRQQPAANCLPLAGIYRRCVLRLIDPDHQRFGAIPVRNVLGERRVI